MNFNIKVGKIRHVLFRRNARERFLLVSFLGYGEVNLFKYIAYAGSDKWRSHFAPSDHEGIAKFERRQIVTKSKELKRANQILDLFVIETKPEELSPVRSDVF